MLRPQDRQKWTPVGQSPSLLSPRPGQGFPSHTSLTSARGLVPTRSLQKALPAGRRGHGLSAMQPGGRLVLCTQCGEVPRGEAYHAAAGTPAQGQVSARRLGNLLNSLQTPGHRVMFQGGTEGGGGHTYIVVLEGVEEVPS